MISANRYSYLPSALLLPAAAGLLCKGVEKVRAKDRLVECEQRGVRLREKRASEGVVGGRPPEPPLRPAWSHMPPRPVRLKVLVQQGARGTCCYWPIEV